MAGGHMKYRALSRKSSHRQALLRNLVTSLFKHEAISTTWHKAKEAQRLAEKVVTLAKKNTEASRRRVEQILYTPHEIMPKIFQRIGPRYAERPGGYTRVLRIEPLKEDQAESAILELVDGPKDMRFAMTAKTLAALPEKQMMNEVTAKNVQKATRFRKDGMSELRSMVERMRELNENEHEAKAPYLRPVYPEISFKKDMHYPQ
ncbi:ribosomal protein L17 [Lophiostoma macrostomum CBS 122681]|uniref:Large ribosomal subunit protein bL17m n=1 Tax=Lophiostoma macrostomum CBS 122681 TaxID=1314788 RepID=A0A6A6SNS1_9PLEO|nr:ribosomal protein L17 [Lophiostoma macrostomum CBS 122681]